MPRRLDDLWFFGLLLLVLILGMPGFPARAAESSAVVTAHATAWLISGSDTAETGRPIWIGLKLRLQPGWHVYWRNPGDAGQPPDLGLSAANVQFGDVAWPWPERIPEGPLTAFGYTGDIVLPVQVTPIAGGGLLLRANAHWLACASICVPEAADLRLTIPEGVARPSAQAPMIEAALARVPQPASFVATITSQGVLSIRNMKGGPGGAMFFPDQPDRIAASAPQPRHDQDAGFDLQLTWSADAAKDQNLPGVLVIAQSDGQTKAWRIDAIHRAATPRWRVLHLVLLALLGGMVLNVMPCVFPIVAMKAIAVLRLPRDDRRARLVAAIGYAVGVVISLTGLGVALLALRHGGAALGWGYQLQSPPMVALLSWILILAGLNLSGVFAVPSWAIRTSGGNPAGDPGWPGSILTGVLAVVVATPCTAPFMGAAIGGAMIVPPWQGVLIFVALGVGFALPAVLLAIMPQWGRMLPRSGTWMSDIRGLLAFPLYGGAIWLWWVLARQTGPDRAAIGLAGALLTGFGAWQLGRTQSRNAGTARRVGLIGFAASVGAAAVLLRWVDPPAQTNLADGRADTAAFSPERLAALQADHRPVLVDMTASWCLTCLVNEKFVLDTTPIQAALAQAHVTVLRGDWTARDPAITRFLERYQQDGVPLTAFFPSQGGDAVILPSVLTAARVLQAVRADKAAGTDTGS